VWAGEDGVNPDRATQVPVVNSVGFGFDTLDEWLEVASGRTPGHIYSRTTNPTVAVFEEKMRILEGGDAATAAASGMGAISATLYALLKPRDRVVSVKDVYGGVSVLFGEFLPAWGVAVDQVDTTDVDAIEESIGRGCDVLYLETPTNPTLKVLDIARLTKAAHDAGATVVVDNTVATPINQNPLALGADLVVHSATKYLGGHADALGGVAIGSRELVDRVFHYREINGAALHASTAYLLIRGVKTLQIRVDRQNLNASTVAEYLTTHAKVENVNYPGLPEHPHHDVAVRQMSGFGGMLSFSLRGGIEAVERFLAAVPNAHRAANLGAVETTIGVPSTTSHVECSAEERAALGIPEGLVRYSAGIEDCDDLLLSLEKALDKA
jgi:cystathionine gamma-synthase